MQTGIVQAPIAVKSRTVEGLNMTRAQTQSSLESVSAALLWPYANSSLVS